MTDLSQRVPFDSEADLAAEIECCQNVSDSEKLARMIWPMLLSSPQSDATRQWHEVLAERVAQLHDAGAKHLTCNQVLGLIAFVRDGEGCSRSPVVTSSLRQGISGKFTDGDPVEIRKQNDAIDEICIRAGDVHIEQMSADGWFMGVEASDGSYWQFWFGSKNRKAAVEFRHTEHSPAGKAAMVFDRGCQCEHPLIKCDQTGCRCTICGELERHPTAFSSTDREA